MTLRVHAVEHDVEVVTLRCVMPRDAVSLGTASASKVPRLALEFIRAEGPCEKSAVVRLAVELDDECAGKFGFVENHEDRSFRVSPLDFLLS